MMKTDRQKPHAPGPLTVPLHAVDRRRLEAYAMAFAAAPTAIAADILRQILRSLPPPKKQSQPPFSDFMAAELARARETHAAAMKAAGEADAAASRAGTLIDLIEPSLHRLHPLSS